MPFNFNSPAVNFGEPSMPIGQSLKSDRPFDPDILLGVHPVLNWPTPVVKNVMFYIDRRLKGNHELEQYAIGVPCNFITGSLVTTAMREAVLTHYEPLPQYAKDNVYRFFYVVPPTLQHLYNIQMMKKDTDGYTLEGLELNTPPTIPPAPFKQFYEIQRVFVYLRERGYAPAEIGTFDPSNTNVAPDFNEDHGYDGYDAQLVHEEVIPFEEDYMNKVFVRVVRIYRTLPGPVVKELLTYTSYVNGQTVWIQGGPESGMQGIAEVGQRWSREVWGFPTKAGTSETSAKIPLMPKEALDAEKVNKGWDKGSFPCLQTYTITQMYKSNSNIPLQENTDSLSGNCCNPPPAFVRCVNTSTTRSEDIDWSANGDLPPLNPPDPSEGCSQWRVDASVVVREGYSHKETRKTCTTYDMVDHYFETEIDSKTGNEIVVQHTRVDNPAQKPEGPDWAEVTDPVSGVKTWVRQSTPPEVKGITFQSPDWQDSPGYYHPYSFVWGDISEPRYLSTTEDLKWYTRASSEIRSATMAVADSNIQGVPLDINALIQVYESDNRTLAGTYRSVPKLLSTGNYLTTFNFSTPAQVKPGQYVYLSLEITETKEPVAMGYCNVADGANRGYVSSVPSSSYDSYGMGAYVSFQTISTMPEEGAVPKGYLMYRKWINPCHAVDILRPVPGLGWYKRYTTVQNYSFPPILGSFGWQGWDTRPDLSGRVGGRYFPQIFMNRDGYSGPCTAIVEEVFSPDATLPAGWGLGVDVQFVTASASISTPLVSFTLPACLHGAINIQVSVGTNDGVWQSGVASYTLQATKHTSWKNVTMVHVFPHQQGAFMRRTTIYPPS